MRIKFWGTRGTRPTPGRRTLRYGGNTTCIEVRDRHDNLIIIDSGSGIAELGADLAQDTALQAHLLITHTHLDHIQGFPFFSPAFVPGTHLTIVGPAGSAKSLQAAFAYLTGNRDQATLTQAAYGASWRIAASYAFSWDSVGAQSPAASKTVAVTHAPVYRSAFSVPLTLTVPE